MKSLLFISLIAISATAVNAQCPPVPVITGSHALCGDDYVMVTATNLPASAFMLYWYRDGIFYSNNNPGSLMHDAGTYTVKTYSNGCYSALSDPFVLTQYQRPTLTSEGNVTSICPTGGTVNLIVTGGTAPYSWTLNGNVIPGAITATYAATTGGSYYVYSGSPSSCGASTGINLWTVTVPTNVVLSSALPIACGPTNMASVTISSSMAGASFTLYKDGIAHNTNLTSTAAAPAGTYLAKWNNPNGCEVSSNTLVIAPNTNPTPVITPGEGSTFCRGTALTVSNVGTTYQWFMGNATQGGETSPSTIPYMSDLWRVRVGFANGCFTTVEVNVTVNQLPIVSVQRYGSDPNCGPQVLRASTNGGSGTNSYKWFRDGIEIAGAISYDYTANQSGNYVAAITRNGCVGTNTPFTFTYNPIPSLSLTADGPTSFCQGGAVTLTASGGTAPYVWKRDGAIMSGVTGSSYTVTNPINMTNRYSVTWTTPAGCSATSNLIYVSIMPTTQIYVTNLTGNGCNSEGVNLQTNYGGIGGWIWKKDGY